MASTRESSGNKRKRQLASLPPWIVPVITTSDALYTFCLVTGTLALVVLCAMIFLGQVGSDYAWVNTLNTAFIALFVIGFLAVAVARYDSAAVGWVGAIVGGTFIFGGPLAVAWLASASGHNHDQSAAQFVQTFNGTINSLGIYFSAIAVMHLILLYTYRLIYADPEAGAKQYKYSTPTSGKKHGKPSMIPKCWEMSRCRPGVRQSCPNYLDKNTCWKRRSGCFCDRELANFLVSNSDRKETMEVVELQTTHAAEMRSHLQNASRRPWNQQRLLCHECPLYLEHQEYKYRYWHWISFPVTFALVFSCYSLFHIAYVQVAHYIDLIMQQLVRMGKFPDNFAPSAAGLEHSPFEYILLAMLALLLTSYVVGLTDTIFLKWKL